MKGKVFFYTTGKYERSIRSFVSSYYRFEESVYLFTREKEGIRLVDERTVGVDGLLKFESAFYKRIPRHP